MVLLQYELTVHVQYVLSIKIIIKQMDTTETDIIIKEASISYIIVNVSTHFHLITYLNIVHHHKGCEVKDL